MNIYEKLVDTQGRLKAPKGQFNSFGRYKYRSCEDILEGLKPLLVEHKVVLNLSDKVIEMDNGIAYVEATAQFKDMDGVIEVKAQAGIEPNKKGMDIAQSFGTSSSYARKYALNGLFLIDDTKDNDTLDNTKKNIDSSYNPNLPFLDKNGEIFNKAVQAIKSGKTSINAIKKKYNIKPEVESLLNK